jgi:hypothetical protein
MGHWFRDIPQSLQRRVLELSPYKRGFYGNIETSAAVLVMP